MTDEVGAVRFTSYYGHPVYVMADRVLLIEDGGFGSRGISTVIHFDTGLKISVGEDHRKVARRIDGARSHG